jgi:hypothetical protein
MRQHLFSAVACSKKCAVAVLTAELPVEEAEREPEWGFLDKYFPGLSTGG